jgi:hypothetical protein
VAEVEQVYIVLQLSVDLVVEELILIPLEQLAHSVKDLVEVMLIKHQLTLAVVAVELEKLVTII